MLQAKYRIRCRREKRQRLCTCASATAALALLIGVVIRNAPSVQAQSPGTLPLSASARRFEVASIHLCKGSFSAVRGGKEGGEGGDGRIRWDAGRLHEECQSIENLIRDAYLAYPEGKPWSTGTRQEPSADATGMINAGCTGCGRGFPPVSFRQFREPIRAVSAGLALLAIPSMPRPSTPPVPK